MKRDQCYISTYIINNIDRIHRQIIQKLTASIGNDDKWLSESDKNKIILKLSDLNVIGGVSQVYADNKFRDVYTDRYSEVLVTSLKLLYRLN